MNENPPVLSLAQLQQMGQGYANQISPEVFSLDDLKAQRATQEVENNAFSPLLSGALGFANATSFGLASQIAAKSGLVEQETLSALKNVNPISYTAGELASFVVPGTPLAKGSGLVAKSLRTATSPIQQVAKAGQFVNAATQARLGSIIGSTRAADVVSKIAGSGLGSAVEGAAYGVQQFISDEAMGDPDANAETFLARVGTSFALAGGFGAGFSALGQGFKLAANNYKDGARGIFKTVSGLDDEVIEEVASDRGYAKMQALMKQSGENSEKVADYAKRKFSIFNARKDQWVNQWDDATEVAVQKLDNTIAPVTLKEVVDDLDDVIKSTRAGQFTPPEDVKTIAKIVKELEEYKTIISKAAFDNAEKYGLASLVKQDLKKFRGLSAKEKSRLLERELGTKALREELTLKPSQLNRIRVELNKVAQRRNVYDPFKETKAGGEEFANFNNRIRERLYGKAPKDSEFAQLNAQWGKQKNALDQLKTFKIQDKEFSKLGSEEKVVQLLSGRSGRAQQARKFLQDLDDVYGTDLANTQKFLNAFDKVTQSKLAPILTGYSQMLPAMGAMLGLSVGLSPAAAGAFYLAGAAAQAPFLRAPIIRGATKLSKGIDEAFVLKTQAGKAVPPGMVPFIAAKIAAMGQIERDVRATQKPFEDGLDFIIEDKGLPFDDLREFKKTPDEIYEIQSDPQKFEEMFEQNSKELIFAYPGFVEPLKQKLQNQLQYLAEISPKETNSEFLFDQPEIQSDADKQKFQDRANVLEDPRHVLKAAKENRLTTDMINTFKQFYPNLYYKIVSKVYEVKPEKMKKMNYDQRQQLSLLLGQPLTSPLRPDRFMALQQNFAAQNQDIQQGAQNDLKGLEDRLNNMRTQGQIVEEN